MRLFFFFPVLLLTACASKQALHTPPLVAPSVPGTVLPSEAIESIRYAENIKSYNVGRYVDPHNSRVMHEAHLVYRVETTAKWNLHPNPPAALAGGPVAGIVDPARKEIPVNDEIIAEVNRQKAATQALLDQGSRLSEALQKLSDTTLANKQIAEQNAQLTQQLNETERRLELLESNLQNPPAAPEPLKPVDEDW